MSWWRRKGQERRLCCHGNQRRGVSRRSQGICIESCCKGKWEKKEASTGRDNGRWLEALTDTISWSSVAGKSNWGITNEQKVGSEGLVSALSSSTCIIPTQSYSIGPEMTPWSRAQAQRGQEVHPRPHSKKVDCLGMCRQASSTLFRTPRHQSVQSW